MSIALCMVGWVLCIGFALALRRLRRRLELVACAAHELRGPATAIGLAASTLARQPGGSAAAAALEVQLERMRLGLRDLELARSGRRSDPAASPIVLERFLEAIARGWRPVAAAAGRGLELRSEVGEAAVEADRGRLTQALGNLLSNAIEHGGGVVELNGRRSGDRVVLEVRDQGEADRSHARSAPGQGRGRGLRIAAAAVEEAGGRLTLARHDAGTGAEVELPAVER